MVEGKEDGAARDLDYVEEKDLGTSLERWEIEHGKYGVEYFGIGELMSDFKVKMDFGIIDKYIKETLKENGWETEEGWQKTIEEIEQEIGTQKLDPFKRLKRIAEYITVTKKIRSLKEKQALYKV